MCVKVGCLCRFGLLRRASLDLKKYRCFVDEFVCAVPVDQCFC